MKIYTAQDLEDLSYEEGAELVPMELMRSKEFTVAEKLILVELMNMDAEDKPLFLTYNSIGEKCGLTVSVTQKAIRKLEKTGSLKSQKLSKQVMLNNDPSNLTSVVGKQYEILTSYYDKAAMVEEKNKFKKKQESYFRKKEQAGQCGGSL